MNAAKLLLHASLAGVYGSLYLAFFLRAANRGAEAPGVAALLPVVVVYALLAGIVWSLLYGLLRFFARHRLRLVWFSLRYVLPFHAVNSAVIIAACWSTVSRYRRVFEPETAGRLELACGGAALAWLISAAVSVVPVLRRSSWAPTGAAGLALIALFLPLGVGAPEPGRAYAPGDRRPLSAPPRHTLIFLNFDGADLEDVLTLVSQGKLPALSRMHEEGAHGRLQSEEPCVAAVTRTTLVSGKLPYRHGVRGGFERRLLGAEPPIAVVPPRIGFDSLLGPFQQSRRLSLVDRSTLALWEMLELLGGSSVSGGWELDFEGDAATSGDAESGTLSQARVMELLGLPPAAPAGSVVGDRFDDLREALQADERVAALLQAGGDGDRPELIALSFPGLDRVAHAFLRYARPREFGNVTREEIERNGPVFEGYYRYVDSIVGRVLETWGDQATLFVTSSHGMAPIAVHDRLLASVSGGGSLTGSHEDAPGGLLFARGPDILAGHAFGRGSIGDVVPTALYALGRPVARDLDGRIRTGIFSNRHTERHAVTVIDSYEALR
ncbi:MAG TPA: alkaline phosphatase family protein [Candidatus Polarisedimenticolia bacterium]|nr:alkaline phosphatase family protein [Candidatus Polarisedimenticolia bacterium]